MSKNIRKIVVFILFFLTIFSEAFAYQLTFVDQSLENCTTVASNYIDVLQTIKQGNSYIIKNLENGTQLTVINSNKQEYLGTFLFLKQGIKKYILPFDYEYIYKEYQEAGFTSIPDITVLNTRTYDWYVDQGFTGKYSDSNCGPATTLMALRWVYPNTKITVEQEREEIHPDGSWWWTYDIYNYLKKNKVDAAYKHINDAKDLQNIIDDGNIAILDINPIKISKGYNRIGDIYPTDTGHFIVLMGYTKAGNNTYFEVFDPASYGQKSDNIPIRQGRYYILNELLNAINARWSYAIVVKGNES